MKQTANYQLNQWEKTDRIQMEDFNADNAKIDAALAEQTAALAEQVSALRQEIEAAKGETCWKKLKEITVTANSNCVNINVSSIDFTQFHRVEVHFSGRVDWPVGIYFRINGQKTGYHFSDQQAGSGSYLASASVTSVTGRRGPAVFTMYFSEDCVAGSATYGYSSSISSMQPLRVNSAGSFLMVPPQDITTLNLEVSSSDYSILSGSRIQLYGLKK